MAVVPALQKEVAGFQWVYDNLRATDVFQQVDRNESDNNEEHG